MNNTSIILLSGGLDSLVSLDYCKKHTNYDIQMALTFDYGQKTASTEVEYSRKICEYYGIKHKVIKLDWLKEITQTSLVSSNNVPTENLNTKGSMSLVWVPNRNSLFLNIAACFCDSFNYKYIVYGANKDEGETFSDNTEKFRDDISKCFEVSTLSHPVVIAPLINYSKDDIVRIAIRDSVPLELVRSCYVLNNNHCGTCESCMHLKRALKNNNCEEYIKILFKDYEN